MDLSLKATDSRIYLAVTDDGVGLEAGPGKKKGAPAGIGLASMKERAELSGGSISIESAVGRGTSITARWDLADRRINQGP